MVKTTPCKLNGLEVLMLLVVRYARVVCSGIGGSVECQNMHAVT